MGPGQCPCVRGAAGRPGGDRGLGGSCRWLTTSLPLAAEVLDWLDGGVSREPGARPPTPVDKASPEEPLGAMTRVPGGLGLAGGCCTRGCTRRQMTRFC